MMATLGEDIVFVLSDAGESVGDERIFFIYTIRFSVGSRHGEHPYGRLNS
jgi:hypothetical protein